MRLRRSQAPAPTALERRVSRIPTADLPQWADDSLFTVGRAVSNFRRRYAPEALAEAIEGAEALTAVLKELRSRTGS